ncbi:hypothetical protein COSO111634_25470 [Corallococcus soli]
MVLSTRFAALRCMWKSDTLSPLDDRLLNSTLPVVCMERKSKLCRPPNATLSLKRLSLPRIEYR